MSPHREVSCPPLPKPPILLMARVGSWGPLWYYTCLDGGSSRDGEAGVNLSGRGCSTLEHMAQARMGSTGRTDPQGSLRESVTWSPRASWPALCPSAEAGEALCSPAGERGVGSTARSQAAASRPQIISVASAWSGRRPRGLGGARRGRL